ncbi:MAG TPA: hypothetical protein VHF23_05280 [Gaiellaceae bacterium]|nr:hypothetical protein [Gaiellaceae bacterium]
MTAGPDRVRLVDAPDESGRTTATLLASLAARLATLLAISGSDAIGSLTAGFAALGREVGKTAPGARLRSALETGRPGANGNALWSALRIEEWASSLPPSPVLDQLRNDVALLLADDLEETLELLPIPGAAAGARGSAEPEAATFLDFAVGFWWFCREVASTVEALAEPTLEHESVRPAPASETAPEGSLLR